MAKQTSPAKKVEAAARESAGRTDLPVILSLFSGAGGLDLGFLKAGFDVKLAIDSEGAAIATHESNFPGSVGLIRDLVELGAEGVVRELAKIVKPGSRIGVIGGPPCQGFSRANTRSKKGDPRNRLPSLYVRILKELQVEYRVDFFIFENVLGIRDARHAHRYRRLLSALRALKFEVEEEEYCALDYGVAQNRRRVIISGVAEGRKVSPFRPQPAAGKRTVREAIGEIESEPVFFSRGVASRTSAVHPNHWTMAPLSPKFKNPDALSSDGRSFKRLKWDSPSPTVAYGNREIHVHPTGTRRLSIYEAMCLQGFPPSFVLKGNLSEQVRQVSNAVPPPLAEALAAAIKHSMAG